MRADSALQRPAAHMLACAQDRDLPRGKQWGEVDQFSAEVSRSVGARPVLMRCRRILLTSGGSVITASTFMGEPQRLQRSGLSQGCAPLPPQTSTPYTLANSRAQLYGVP